MRNPQLHAAVLADPDDDAPRLVYADWLAERGDPRGELISVQIERARLRPGDPRGASLAVRERELLDLHGARWCAPFGTSFVDHVRGFVERVRTQRVAELSSEAFADACVRTLWIRDRASGICDRARSLLPAMRLSELHLDSVEQALPLAAFTALADALAEVRVLGLHDRCLTVPHVDAMLASRGLGAVEALHVTECRPAHLERLAGWPRPLRALSIRYGAGMGFARHVHAPAFARLEVLDLCRSRITTGDLRAIVASEMPLRELDLMYCEIDAEDAGCIANAPHLASLARLNVAHTRMGLPGLEALCASPYLSRRMTLAIDGDVLGLSPDYAFDDQGRAYEGSWKGPIDERWTSRFDIVLTGSSL